MTLALTILGIVAYAVFLLGVWAFCAAAGDADRAAGLD